MTITHQDAAETTRAGFQEHFEMLTDHEKLWFGALEADAMNVNNRLCRARITKKRNHGTYRHVILTEGEPFGTVFTSCGFHQSTLTLDHGGVLTLDTIEKLAGLLRMKGYRTTAPIWHDACPRDGVDKPYIELGYIVEAA